MPWQRFALSEWQESLLVCFLRNYDCPVLINQRDVHAESTFYKEKFCRSFPLNMKTEVVNEKSAQRDANTARWL